jgi:nucleoside-diphosphate-sugar epimerase
MRVLVTGASSFLGAHLVRWLAENRPGWDVVAVVNRTGLSLQGVRPTVVRSDLTDPAAAAALAEHRPDAVVHQACKVADPDVNRAMLATVLDLSRMTGARLVHCSTTQVSWQRKNAYARGRAEEEATVASSGVNHVILRPCAPYGPKLPDHTPAHRESFHLLADLVKTWPAVPMIGGAQLRQPVHVRDWSDVIARFLDRERLPDAAFDVGGPMAMPFEAIVDRLSLQLGRRVRPIKVPVRLAKVGALFVPGFTPDLMDTFTCDDAVDLGPLVAELGKTDWIRFEDGARDLVSGWTHWAARRNA